MSGPHLEDAPEIVDPGTAVIASLYRRPDRQGDDEPTSH